MPVNLSLTDVCGPHLVPEPRELVLLGEQRLGQGLRLPLLVLSPITQCPTRFHQESVKGALCSELKTLQQQLLLLLVDTIPMGDGPT